MAQGFTRASGFRLMYTFRQPGADVSARCADCLHRQGGLVGPTSRSVDVQVSRMFMSSALTVASNISLGQQGSARTPRCECLNLHNKQSAKLRLLVGDP